MVTSLALQARWYEELLPLDREVVVDVGANVGELSRFFATTHGGRNRVLSVEPLSENIREIEAKIAAIPGAAERWTIAPCAVSSRDAKVRLRLGRSEDGDVATAHNSVVVEPGAPKGPDEREVDAKTLSAICPDATVIKLDIEGHEYAVLDQSLDALGSVKAWAIELHMTDRRLSDTIGALRSRGFRVFGAGRRRSDPTGPWVTAEVPPSLEWANLPVASTHHDGSVFKMLHVVARRA
ncbi:MAG: FkbM family methyltransferase [Myxococcales bacterium]|nr:FkbM family methyltransferase [Myxococcales bacterium]